MRTGRIFCLAAVAAVAMAVGLSAGATLAWAATTNATSTTFGGYAGLVTKPVSATTNFKLEAITCASTNEGMAPGVVLMDSSTSVISSGSIFESCLTGTPSYSAVAVVNNVQTTLPIPVAAGHKISITVTVSSKATTVQIVNNTTLIGKKAVGAGGTPNTLRVGITPLYSGSGTLLDVPTFLSERFNSTKVNGAPLSKINPTATNRVTSAGVVQIRTGTLNTAGVDFTEFFRRH